MQVGTDVHVKLASLLAIKNHATNFHRKTFLKKMLFCDFSQIPLFSPFLVNNVEIAGYYQLLAVDILSRTLYMGFIIPSKFTHLNTWLLYKK